MAKITANRIELDSDYYEEKGGILNALSFASAQYIYRVVEQHNRREEIKQFDNEKLSNLRRAIVHKNAHLDEYFAELLFRSFLPQRLKDLELKEHTLISKDNDAFAKISFPNAVVFGIGADEAGGANALQIFDEHLSDGTRVKPSCSQLVAEEFLGQKIPRSIQTVLDEVNTSDSSKGAHQYNFKNVISSMHDTLFTVSYDEYQKADVSKYLTENWKRAVIDVCIVAMIYAYENGIYKNWEFNERFKIEIEKATKQSLDYFLENTYLSKFDAFAAVRGTLLYHFKVGNHDAIDKAIWRTPEGKKFADQILTIHRICYALEMCWGKEICLFAMMHIWQCKFQEQMMFKEILEEIKNLPDGLEVKTKFGSVLKILINQPNFQPEQKSTDTRKRTFKENAPLWLFQINVTMPNYFNTATVFKSLINNDYTQKGNNGFGLFLLHDKTINSKIVNNGPTIPYEVWKKISDAVCAEESDRWFQLKAKDGNYADFILNRNKAHQEHLPSNKIDIEFLRKVIGHL